MTLEEYYQMLSNYYKFKTLPDDRYSSVVEAREFLKSLMNPRITPRVPKRFRTMARTILQHFPDDDDMTQLSKRCPDLFQPHIEAVKKLLMRHEQNQSNS